MELSAASRYATKNGAKLITQGQIRIPFGKGCGSYTDSLLRDRCNGLRVQRHDRPPSGGGTTAEQRLVSRVCHSPRPRGMPHLSDYLKLSWGLINSIRAIFVHLRAA
jgi:hypothetical protein